MAEEKIKKQVFKKSLEYIEDYFKHTGFYDDLSDNQKDEFNDVINNIKEFYEVQDFRFDEKGNLNNDEYPYDKIYNN